METDPTRRIFRESGTESESNGNGSVSENSTESNQLTFEQFQVESKKLQDFADSLVDKMPGKNFDFKDAKSWDAFAEIFNEFRIKEREYIKGLVLTDEQKNSFSYKIDMTNAWFNEHMLAGSKVHKADSDLQVLMLNRGIFNSLVDEGNLKNEDRDTFLKMMPEYTQLSGAPLWNITSVEGLTDEVKRKIYEEKAFAYDSLSEKAGSAEMLDANIAAIARWVNNVYFSCQNEENDHSDWQAGEEKPTEEFMTAFKKSLGGGLQYAHTALYYFTHLKQGVRPNV